MNEYTDNVNVGKKYEETYTPPYLIPGSFRTYKLSDLKGANSSYAHIVGNNVSWVLPVPNLLNYDSDYNWSEEDLGWQGELATNVATKIDDWIKGTNNSSLGWADIGKAVGDLARSGVGKLTNDTVSKSLMKTQGVAYNPNKQLFFNEVTMRDFEVYFYLAPMSMEEANNIKNSFKKLVNAAAPGYALDKFFFTYPDFFNFSVTLNGNLMYERKNLAITRVSLDFTSDGNMTWHEDGFPTSLQLTIGFKESQLPTKENLANITVFGVKLGNK
jgi:hypothetical protein